MPIFQLSKLEKGNVSPQSGKHFLVRLAHVSAFFFFLVKKEQQSVVP